MKKIRKQLRSITACLLSAIMLIGCSGKEIRMGGFYQSDFIGTELVQITVDAKSGEFIEYISSRQVNAGTCTKGEDGLYQFKGDVTSFDVTLNADDTFSVTIPKLNDGEPILLSQVSGDKNVITEIGGQEQYGDREKYIDLLR